MFISSLLETRELCQTFSQIFLERDSLYQLMGISPIHSHHSSGVQILNIIYSHHNWTHPILLIFSRLSHQNRLLLCMRVENWEQNISSLWSSYHPIVTMNISLWRPVISRSISINAILIHWDGSMSPVNILEQSISQLQSRRFSPGIARKITL
jgi:hypothetical protein